MVIAQRVSARTDGTTMHKYIDVDSLRFPNICIFDMKLHGVTVPMVRLVDLQKLIPAADVVERPRWISIEERLPNPEVEVLVFTQDGVIGVDKFFGVVFGFPFFSKRGVKRVTHWMPLPEPPKEEL